MIHTRQMTAASVLALGFLSVPAQAQQNLIYNDPAFQQPQGQVFQPQQPFGNQPIFVDPNTGQPLLPQQPNFQQPRQDFGQQQQPQFQPQPQPQFQQPQQPSFGQPLQPTQPNFGQQLPQPQPNFGSPLPQPGQAYNPPQPAITVAPEPPTVPLQQPNPYYDRAGTPPAPGQAPPGPAPTVDVSLPAPTPEAQGDSIEAPSSPAPAFAAPGTDRGPQMSAELDALLAVGERYRAASPGFLEDLKTLARKYRDPLPPAPTPVALDPSAPPATDDLAALPEQQTTDPLAVEPNLAPSDPATVSPFDSGGEAVTVVPPLDPGSVSFAYLEDDFTDGEIDNNPSWRVRQGDWAVDPKYGLRAKTPEQVSDAPVSPKELLKVLLTGDAPASNGTSAAPQAALIEAQTDIGNAFSFAARIVDHAGTGTAHFIMHQGGSNWLGYRLELRSGPRPVVVLTRRGSNGYKDITKVSAPEFTTGKEHELRWARLSTGQMIVLLNGRPIITSRDTVFRENWSGFAFFNAGGDVSIRTIRVSAPVER